MSSLERPRAAAGVERDGPRHASLARSRHAIPFAIATGIGALSMYLACGAVAPTEAGAALRVGILPTSAAAWGSALATLAAGAWLSSRRAAAPLWLLAILLVPWLPVSADGAALMWHGPAAAAVIGATVLLVVWPALARAGRLVARRRTSEQAALAFVVAAIVYGLAAWRMQPQLPGGDEPHYLVITQSLLADGDLRIENNHRQGDYRAYTAQELRPDFLRRGTDGQIYSIHAPGLSAMVLPAFALAGYPGVVVWLVLVSAFGTTLAWLAGRHLAGDAASAWAGWAAVALSAPFFLHAFTVYPDGTGAVLTMVCVCGLVAPERLRSRAACAACGTAAAVLPWLHTRYAIIAAIAGVLLALRAFERPERRVQRLAALAAVPLVSAVAWLGFFHAIYGTFNPSAPYGGYTQSSILSAPTGLSGLLIDQQFGLLPNAPVYAFAFAGLWSLWSVRRRLALELLAIVVPYAVAAASYHMWWGGRSAPARFLVPVLLPLALPVAVHWRRAGTLARTVAGAAIACSVALSAALAWVDRGALVYNVRDGYALWLDAFAPLVRLPLALPSLFRGSTATAWTIALAWAAVLGIAVSVVRVLVHRADDGCRVSFQFLPPAGPAGASGSAAPALRLFVPVAAALIAGVTVAAAVSWRITGVEGEDAGAGLLRVLRAADADGGIGWHSKRPLTLVSAAALRSSLLLPSEERRLPDAASPGWSGTNVPPGRYELVSTSGLRVHGRLAVLFGRDGVPLVDTSLRDEPPGVLPVGVDLPGGAKVLRMQFDRDARRTAEPVGLRIVSPIPASGRAPGTYAGRLLRAGVTTAWFLDDNAFVEPGAFWVRGESEAVLVLDGAGHAPDVVVRAGPVPASVTVTVGRGAPRVVTLAPAALAAISVAAQTPVAVRIASSSGFRPRDRDPLSTDARWLGVRVELGQNLATAPK